MSIPGITCKFLYVLSKPKSDSYIIGADVQLLIYYQHLSVFSENVLFFIYMLTLIYL